MLSAPNFFREKLTLFWHDHFATAISKVNDTRLMANQIDTLRKLSLGKFRDIVLAMARDPARREAQARAEAKRRDEEKRL